MTSETYFSSKLHNITVRVRGNVAKIYDYETHLSWVIRKKGGRWPVVGNPRHIIAMAMVRYVEDELAKDNKKSLTS